MQETEARALVRMSSGFCALSWPTIKRGGRTSNAKCLFSRWEDLVVFLGQ